MMMPMGSDDAVSLRSFFIVISLLWVPPVARPYGKHWTCRASRGRQVVAIQRLPNEILFYGEQTVAK
jgi:hypothetical protein